MQQSFDFRTWGGKRKGAGRRPKGKKASERHAERPSLREGSVVFITLRTAQNVPNLRTPLGYHAFRFALYAILGRPGFRIVHISIQRNHVHLIAEADSKDALSRGMAAFEISAAKQLNGGLQRAGIERTGSLFPDRYHERVLTSPRQTRNAIAYVLNNWRRHGEDRNVPARKVDPYSSGVSFGGWKELDGSPVLYQVPEGYKRLSVSYPKTWLLRVGWMKAGTISVWEVPGPDANGTSTPGDVRVVHRATACHGATRVGVSQQLSRARGGGTLKPRERHRFAAFMSREVRCVVCIRGPYSGNQ